MSSFQWTRGSGCCQTLRTVGNIIETDRAVITQFNGPQVANRKGLVDLLRNPSAGYRALQKRNVGKRWEQ